MPSGSRGVCKAEHERGLLEGPGSGRELVMAATVWPWSGPCLLQASVGPLAGWVGSLLGSLSHDLLRLVASEWFEQELRPHFTDGES